MKNKTKQKESENKKILSNYIILIIVFVLVIGIALYVSKLYKINEAEKQKIPVIHGMLQEIYQDDLEHYVLDTPETIVYICAANDETCRTFERDFKKLLKKNPDYSNQIVYLNLTDVDNNNFINSFNNNFQYKRNLNTNYPVFIVFEDGKVKSIIQGKENSPLTISKVKQFLELNTIGEEE